MGRAAKKTNHVNEKDLRGKVRLSSETPFCVQEAYKVARTNIMFSAPEEGCKTIIVTSPFPEEGKTTTCTNLALSFAQMGKKVLLLDCDLRKSQIHNTLGVDNLVGISNVLGGFVKLKDTVQILEEENLHVITAGHIPPNPAELLSSSRMAAILEELAGSYDYIFIDTPPVNVVTDAVALSGYTSGMIVVTRQDSTSHKDLEHALGKLSFAKAKVLGLILTGEKRRGIGYRKYGKYNKYGKYGSYRKYAAYE